MKKILFWLQHLDGVWSVPLAMAAFYFGGMLLQSIGGLGTGSYDMAFFQPLFLAIGIVIGATNAGIWGLRFTFRGLYQYIYGEKKQGIRRNYSKENWQNLTAWQRYLIAFGCFFYYVTAIIVVYLNLV